MSVCVSVFLAFTAYISLTMGRILIKLSKTVGTVVILIVLKFHCVMSLGLCAFSEHFESIETHFFFRNVNEPEAQNARAKRERCETETLATAIFLYC